MKNRTHNSLPAFTLIEVLLAIVIITGLLSVALFFYQQAARLRNEVLAEAEQISAARLIMDKITTELRCARRHSFYETPLVGQSSSIQFITTALPARAAWGGETYGRISRPETDLKFVSYKAAVSEDGTNSAGLSRAEEPLVTFRAVANQSADVFSRPATNRFDPVLITDQLRALRLRYWDGSAWQDSWNGSRLPAAVEITISPDPLPELIEGVPNVSIDEPPPRNVFRRVVYLPGSDAPGPASKQSSTNLMEIDMEVAL
jgi:type II secretory pathway pseudopilin PulG